MVNMDFRENASDLCPGSLINRTDSDIRTCVTPDSLASGCASVEHSVSGITYSSVCGKIIAYQIGGPEAGLCTWYWHYFLDSIRSIFGWYQPHPWKSHETYLVLCCGCE